MARFLRGKNGYSNITESNFVPESPPDLNQLDVNPYCIAYRITYLPTNY